MPILASRHRFMLLGAFCVVGALIALYGMDWTGYVQTWIG